MPKLRKKGVGDISAAFADDVAQRTYRGQNILSTITRPRKSKSLKKEKSNNDFRSASKYASQAMRTPALKQLYSKGINKRLPNAYTVALTDYMNAPEIHYVNLQKHRGAVGDEIRIKVTDDFEVAKVDIVITNAKGEELEKGPAVRYGRKPAIWVYTLQVANHDLVGTVINVKAKDRPDNKVEVKATIADDLTATLSEPKVTLA
jgi:hypothetical protein